MTEKKVFLVTGALEDGIGEAVTARLLSEGCRVIGTYEKEQKDKCTKFESNDNISLLEVDHSNKDSVSELADTLLNQKIDGIINVQMFFNMENPSSFDHEIWEKSIFINLTMPNMLIHLMKQNLNNDASIVIVTSTEGFVGSFGASAYAASKAAVHNLVMTHANNLGTKNIRVNALAAGWIGGVMDTDEVFNMSRDITPLGRLGSPDEVASAVNFLLSSESSFVNGTVLTVDGGYRGVDTIAKYEFNAELSDS